MKLKNNHAHSENKNFLTIKAVGDIAPGDSWIVNDNSIVGLTNKYGCDFIFQSMGDTLTNSDLLIGNLEGVISSSFLTKKMRHPE